MTGLVFPVSALVSHGHSEATHGEVAVLRKLDVFAQTTETNNKRQCKLPRMTFRSRFAFGEMSLQTGSEFPALNFGEVVDLIVELRLNIWRWDI